MKYLLIILMFVSCSPQARLNRLLSKHHDLIKHYDTTIVVRDTVIVNDTVTVKADTLKIGVNLDSLTASFQEAYSDSFYSVSFALDSLKRLKAKVVFKERKIVETDTVTTERVITLPAKVIEIQKPLKDNWWFWAFVTLALFTLLAPILRR